MSKLFFFLWAFSPFGVWGLLRKQKRPCDESNRINKLIMMWLACTQTEQVRRTTARFKSSYFKLVWDATFNEDLFALDMPWLQHDLWEMLMENKR